VKEILSERFGTILEQGQRNSSIVVVYAVLFFRIEGFSWFQVSFKSCSMLVATIVSLSTWNYSKKAILLPSPSRKFVSGQRIVMIIVRF
jgi:hypothetical protein